MVRTWHFHFWGLGSIPGWGTKIPQAMQCGQKKKKVESKVFKLGSSLSLSCLHGEDSGQLRATARP